MASETKIGSYTGTGAALNVSLGFIPDHVHIVNETDGDIAWEWFSGMTDGHALQSVNVVDSGTTGAAGMSKITANGVSAYAGDASNAPGFSVGTALSESAKTFRYVATRNGEY